jgi:hypothetical protein
MVYNFGNTQIETIPAGAHYGAFGDVKVQEVTTKTKHYFVLVLLLQLEAARRTGVRWTLEKKYVLNGRGRGQLLADLCSWTGRTWTVADLEKFDPEATFVGNTAQVLVHHKLTNGKTEAVAGTLLPAAGKEVNVSNDFVRAKDKAQLTAVDATLGGA